MHNSRNARIPHFPHSPSERFSSRLKLRQLDNGKSTSVSIRSQRNESIVRHNKLAFMFSDSIRYALSCHRATWRFRWCAHFASKFLENSFRSRLRANGNESFFLSLSRLLSCDILLFQASQRERIKRKSTHRQRVNGEMHCFN